MYCGRFRTSSSMHKRAFSFIKILWIHIRCDRYKFVRCATPIAYPSCLWQSMPFALWRSFQKIIFRPFVIVINHQSSIVVSRQLSLSIIADRSRQPTNMNISFSPQQTAVDLFVSTFSSRHPHTRYRPRSLSHPRQELRLLLRVVFHRWLHSCC